VITSDMASSPVLAAVLWSPKQRDRAISHIS
jgi:hypothetical protein